ncbi:AI-2E family transporter [Candidatus Vallotia tarda]|uniref:Hypothetical membrane spanning protein n=1 Tax=Candidatus Vallotiella hemipterorum TaxID=1177213 RepID=A0A916JRK6_9BURK|nr:hypothetical protein [Candidatus Vallotia tarda]CAG7596844.1 Hypothetical membrane spanning protein [Candidatus Vallotia tarda]
MATEYKIARLSNDRADSANGQCSVSYPFPKFAIVDIISYLLMAVAMLLIIKLKLLSALLAGLFAYQIVQQISPCLEHYLSSQSARWFSVVLIACIVVLGFTGISLEIAQHLKHSVTSTQELFEHVVCYLEQKVTQLPAWILEYLPINTAEIKSNISIFLYSHATQLQEGGKIILRSVSHILVGTVLGSIIAVSVLDKSNRAPLPAALVMRITRFTEAFRRIVFAQIKVSALNTFFTGLYLLVALPLFHSRLPLSKTLVIFTFIVGLLPVIGNLISNTMIVLVSLTSGIGIAVYSLIFLIIIHKLEYFVSAHIIGSEIEAKTWELLAAMLVMEAAFGLFGVIAAPLFYAYIKRELVLSNVL